MLWLVAFFNGEYLYFFFFFQAEDGIRDHCVTGVQTCALPICGGANLASLDFDSVQRGNAEIQRRAQQVIDRCWQLGDANPIVSIHDVGAGGLSNAVPEMEIGRASCRERVESADGVEARQNAEQ